jgi:uncharacterized membrane protein
MKLNIFERKQLNQINKTDRLVNEGLGDKVFKWMYGRKFKKIMKGIKEEDDFPEYQSILQNLKQQFEDIQDRYEEGEKVLAKLKADTEARKTRIRKLEKMKR